jgi:hypothetical protein
LELIIETKITCLGAKHADAAMQDDFFGDHASGKREKPRKTPNAAQHRFRR